MYGARINLSRSYGLYGRAKGVGVALTDVPNVGFTFRLLVGSSI